MCPHCRRRTQHFLEWQYRRWDQTVGLNADRDDAFKPPSYYVALCGTCNELLLYINNPPHDDICDNFEGSQPEADTVLVWPEFAVSSEAVPDRVAGLLRRSCSGASDIVELLRHSYQAFVGSDLRR